MTLVLADRVKETSTTTGSGSLTLDGALAGFVAFSDAVGNGNTTYYAIVHRTAVEWEVGIGTVIAGAVSRDTVMSSSNGGAAVNLSAGVKDVFVTLPGEKAFSLDSVHNATSKATPVDADELPIHDSASSFGLSKLTWANIKATLKLYFDGSYVGLSGNQTIVGVKTFSSQPVMPQQSFVRLSGSNGHGTTNTCIRRFSTTLANQGSDITYADSAALGASFTINTAGTYSITYSDNFDQPANMGLSLDSADLATSISNIAAANRLTQGLTSAASYCLSVSVALPLGAGSVIRAHTSGSSSGGNVADFTITRTGG